MNKILLALLLLPTLLFSQGTPRAGGINNGIAPVIPGATHDNFVGVQHTNSNAFGVYSFAVSFDYNLGLKTTDNLAEGSINKYFTNTLARNAFSSGFGLDYSAGVYSLNSTTQGILSSVSNKFNIPTGLTTEYIRGDGSIVTFPTIPTNTNQLTNGAGFITSVPAQSWTSITGKPTFATVSTTGSYNDLINKPTIPTVKRQETYSGTTNSSGIYTVTFTTSYSVAPNIQANIIGATDTQNIRITSITTTGFTVTVRNRVDVIGLLPTWNNVNGASVDILITEK